MQTFQYGDARPVMVPVNPADAYAQGDAVATAAATGVGYRASSQAWATDLATTRANFVARFAGTAAQDKDANRPVFGNGDALGYKLRTDTGGVIRAAVKPGTYRLGDLLGLAKQAGNALEDQVLEAVAALDQATHRVVGREGVNPSHVEAEVLSTVFAPGR